MALSSISNFVDTEAGTTTLYGRSAHRDSAARSSAWSTQETGLTVWFTGLNGSGKTTLANAVARQLRKADVLAVLLDENVLNEGFCAGLGPSREDRSECVRRISELARRLSGNGAVVLVVAVSPYRDTRLAARKRIGRFVEVYVNASGAVREGGPYEAPLAPDVECRMEVQSVDDCAAMVLGAVRRMKAQYVAAGVAG